MNSFAQTQNTCDPKLIRIKLNAQSVEEYQGGDLFNVSSVDLLNEKNGVTSIRRVFPVNSKFKNAHSRYGLDQWFEIEFYDHYGDSDINMLCQVYEKDGSVLEAEPVYLRTIDEGIYEPGLEGVTSETNDPGFEQQWHYQNTGQTGGTIGADVSLSAAWDIQQGSSDVTVAIIDGGVDINHDDLSGNMWVNNAELDGLAGIDDDGNGYIDDVYGYGFGDNTGDIAPHFHGTHVGGTVAANTNNGIGVSGIAGGSGDDDGVRLMSLAVFGANSQGGFAESFVYAADNGAVIAQNSWGGGGRSSVLEDAIQYFIARAGFDNTDDNFDSNIQTGPMAGGLVVFAAGNSNSDNPDIGYPGSLETVVGVASTDHNDVKSSFSNYGEWIDISAPGSSVFSTMPNNEYGLLSGTSMACPHVSGVAALIVSEFGRDGFSPNEVRGRLIGLSDNIDELNPSYIGLLGDGRLNAFTALLTDDGSPPATVTDLAVDFTNFNSIQLTWTASGHNGTEGVASTYEIRYAQEEIDSDNFTDATLATNSINPSVAGSTEIIEIDGLEANTMYYLALKVANVFGNTSEVSNVVLASTTAPPIISASPMSFSADLLTGGVALRELVLSNIGEGMLEFEIRQANRTTSTFVADQLEPLPANALESKSIYEDERSNNRNQLRNFVDKSPASFPEGVGRLFALHDSNSSLVEINPADGSILNSFGLPEALSGGPNGLAFDDQYLYYISGFGSKNVHVIDPTDGSLVETLSFAGLPAIDGLAHSGEFLFALDYTNNVIYQLDTESQTTVAIINPNVTLGGGITFGGSRGSLFVSSFSSAIYEIDLNGTVLNSFSPSGSTWGLAYSEELNVLLLSNVTSGVIEAINPDDGVSIGTILSISSSGIAADEVGAGNWLSISNNSGEILPGEPVNIDLNFDATDLNTGVYEKELVVSSNDISNPSIAIPVTLNVTGVPDLTLSHTSIDFGTQFISTSQTLHVVATNSGFETLNITDISTDHLDFSVDKASLVLEPDESDTVFVSFTPNTNSSFSSVLTFISNDPNEETLEVALSGVGVVPPMISVSPESIEDDLFTGEVRSHILSITNGGGSDLDLSISTVFESDVTSFQSATKTGHSYTSSNHNDSDTALDPTQLTAEYTGEFLHFGISDYGEIMPFQYPIGTSNLEVGAFISGYTVAYEANSIDNISYAGFGRRNRIVPVTFQEITNNDQLIEVEVVTRTSDDILEITRLISFDKGDRYVSIQTSIANVSDQEVTNLVLKSFADWDVDGEAASTDWQIEEHSGTIIAHKVHFVSLASSVTPDFRDIDGWNDFFVRNTDERITEPVMNFDGLEILHFELGGLSPSETLDQSINTTFAADDNIEDLMSTINRGLKRPTWLSVDMDELIIAAGETVEIEVALNAGGLSGDTYTANISMGSNDPITPILTVPVTMNVTGAPDIELSEELLSFDDTFLDQSITDSIFISNVGTDGLSVTEISIDNEFFTVDQMAFDVAVGGTQKLIVTFTPQRAIAESGTMTITSNDPDDPLVQVLFSGIGIEPPEISAVPGAIEDDLFTGEIGIHTLAVTNNGGSELNVTTSTILENTVTSFQPATKTGAGHTLNGQNDSDAVLDPVQLAAEYTGDFLHFGISDYGEIMPFQYPIGTPNLEVGSHISGYTVAYMANSVDNVRYSAFGARNGIIPVTYQEITNNDELIEVEVVTRTSDDILEVTRLISFDKRDRYINIETSIANISDQEVTNLVLKSFADWDVDGDPGGTDWQVEENSGTIIAHNVHFVSLASSITPDFRDINGWNDYFVRNTDEGITEPILNFDGLEVLHFELGSLAPAESLDQSINTTFAADDNIEDLMVTINRGLNRAFWVKINTTELTIAPGETEEMEVELDANGLSGDTYTAEFALQSNDPVTPTLIIPVTLNVTDAPDVEISQESLLLDDTFLGQSTIDSIFIANVGTDRLIVSDISIDNEFFTSDATVFEIAPGEEQKVLITFSPLNATTENGIMTITSNDPDEPSVTVSLSGLGVEPPLISITPESIVDDIFTGETSSHLLTVVNDGGADLEFSARVSTRETEARHSVVGKETWLGFGQNPGERDSQQEAQGVAITNINNIHGEGDQKVLVIQNSSAWGLNLAEFIQTNFEISPDVIGYEDITNVDFSLYDLILTAGDQSGAYYQAISNNVEVFEAFANSGGVVIYQLATHGADIDIIDGARMNYGNQETFNTILLEDHDIVNGLSNPLEGSHANHCYLSDLPESAVVISETTNSHVPTTVEYPYGSGRVIATGMTWEFLFSRGFNSGLMMPQAFEYAINITHSWLSLDVSGGTVSSGGSAELNAIINGTGLTEGTYNAEIIVDSNDPVTSSVVIPVTLNVTGAPDIEISDVSLSLADVLIGNTSIDSVFISNVGHELLSISDVSMDNDVFAVDFTAFDVNPGMQQKLVITFTPSIAVTETGIMTITTNDPDEPTVELALSGIGIPPPVLGLSVERLTQGLLPEQTATQTFEVQNIEGGTPLEFSIELGSEEVLDASQIYSSNKVTSEKNAEVYIGHDPKEVYSFKRNSQMTSVLSGFNTELEVVLDSMDSSFETLTNLIPDIYNFSDGMTGVSINDGGNDMFDGGNVISTNLGINTVYSNNLLSTSSNFGGSGNYFTAKYPGLFFLAADLEGVTEFVITGNLGADGSGSVEGKVISLTHDGRQYLAFLKKVFNAHDPSVNHLVIVEDNGTAVHEFATNTNDDFHRVYNLDNVGRVYYFLFARSSGGYVEDDVFTGITEGLLDMIQTGFFSLSPTRGTIEAGESQIIQARFKSGTSIGQFNQTFSVFSNDPINGEASVDVELYVNEGNTPTDLFISNSAVEENTSIGTKVADLTVEDMDVNDIHTYSLIADFGQNDLFAINGSELLVGDNINFEENEMLELKIMVEDATGLQLEKIFNIDVTDQNDPPGSINLSKFDLDENSEAGLTIGQFIVEDDDPGDTHEITLTSTFENNQFFEISDNSLIVLKSFNFEESPSVDVEFNVVDQLGGTLVQVVTILVNDVNEPATNVLLDNSSVAENMTIGSFIGNLTTEDVDVSDTHIYSLNSDLSDDNEFFEISEQSLVTKTEFNFEEKNVFEIVVTSTDQGGITLDETFAIQITNNNDVPELIILDTDNVHENEVAGTLIGTFTTVDQDEDDSFTYKLKGEGADNEFFEILDNTIVSTVVFDFEEKNSFEIIVTSTDSDGASIDQSFSITITDVNDVPESIVLANDNVEENLEIGTVISTLTVIDQDTDDSFVFELTGTGNDNEFFEISGSEIVSNVVFDYEEKNTFEVSITTTDRGGATLDQSFSISIIDANDAPESLLLEANSISENQVVGTVIGTLIAVDQDVDDSFVFELTGIGNDNEFFEISGSEIISNAVFDYEDKDSFEVQITITDNGGLTLDQLFVININDVNDAPESISLASNRVAENLEIGTIVGTLSVIDQDVNDTFAYELTGTENDNEFFEISGGSVISKIVFDHEEKDSYEILITTTDSGGATLEEPFSIEIDDANDAPESIALETNVIIENKPIGTVIGVFSVVDEDADDSFTFALTGTGNDNEFFEVSSGQIMSKIAFDYESKNSFEVLVETTDSGGASLVESFIINVIDTNDAPESISLGTNHIEENQPTGIIIGTLSTTDQDVEDSFGYELTGTENDNEFFEISGSDVISNFEFDHEDRDSYEILVTSTDSGGATLAQTLSILITDVNDVPESMSLETNNLAENQPIGTTLGTLNVVDQDVGDSFQYELTGTGNDNEFFEISGSDIVSKIEFDFEDRRDYEIAVVGTDTGGATIEATFSIIMEDINDAPESIDLSANSIAENQVIGTVIGIFAVNDQDVNDNFTYALTGADNDNEFFEISGDEVVSNIEFNYEDRSTYEIVVTATDNEGATVEATFSIIIEDINDAPESIDLSANSIAENQDSGTVIGTFTANDQDVGDSFIYELSGSENDNEFFDLVENTLVSKVEFDYENKTEYQIEIKAIDSGENSVTQPFTILIEDVDDDVLSIDQAQILSGLSVYPSPMIDDNLVISIENEVNGLLQISILNLSGKAFKRTELYKTNTNFKHTLYLPELPSGVYLVMILSGETKEVLRFVKN